MTGEVLSRITTDTTLILSRDRLVRSPSRCANPADPDRWDRLMLVTSPKLTGLVLLIVPVVMVPILVLGRRLRVLSRENQDWIAASSGNASEALMSACRRCRPTPTRPCRAPISR
jgi:ATP-binding cassette subfamily B protein